MKAPCKPITLGDLLDDFEAVRQVVALVITRDGINDFYDSEDMEFVDPDLFERYVEAYELKEYTKRKIGLDVVLKGE